MKSVIVEGYVLYNNELVRIETLGGIDEEFILFNPDLRGGFYHFKLQANEKVFFRKLNSNELVNLPHFDEEFILINSTEEIIAYSNDLRPEFVWFFLNKLDITSNQSPNLRYLN